MVRTEKVLVFSYVNKYPWFEENSGVLRLPHMAHESQLLKFTNFMSWQLDKITT